MAKAIKWVLQGEPKSIVITDKDGVKRAPDLEKAKKHPEIRGAYISAGRYASGVGKYFYGGKLGNRAELQAQGNKYTTNDEILTAMGYKKVEVDLG